MSKACVRSAVGAGMLSTVLLIGGPVAVAVADTDSGTGTSGSTGSASGSTGAGQGQNSGRDSGTATSGNDLGVGLRTTLRQSMTGVRKRDQTVDGTASPARLR